MKPGDPPSKKHGSEHRSERKTLPATRHAWSIKTLCFLQLVEKATASPGKKDVADKTALRGVRSLEKPWGKHKRQ